MGFFGRSTPAVTAANALSGRADAMPLPRSHYVNGHAIAPPFPDGLHLAQFGMGCFWGAERAFWELQGVYSTAVGYAGGFTPHPTYREVCSGQTGHSEMVLVVFDPAAISYTQLLKVFWEAHDPTQGMRQGNDVGTQYRSAIYCYDRAQREQADTSRAAFQQALRARRYGDITTEIVGGAGNEATPTFYYAEEYHQQYLAKNPGGYCGLAGTGATCPLPTGVAIPK
ncbi:MAG: peptide-methionine (S)-S-oxide reductase MsrA [Burkholderiales bacterium]|nr:peptide-methionine (S)-S-oxide reductase MsrA [Burkholderiales bacterium]